MKYGVVYDEGKGVEFGLFDDEDKALTFAAHRKVNGARFVQVMVPAEGELVVTAKLVLSGDRTERKAAKRSRPKGSKRTSAELNKLRTRILSWVQTNPGKNVEDLSKAFSIDTKELALPMKKLLSDRSIRKRGKARATRYYPAKVGKSSEA